MMPNSEARKRLADTAPGSDWPLIDETTAGRNALHAAAAYLTDFPSMDGVRVWLLTFAGTYKAGK